MLVFIKKKKYSLSRQGEACKEIIYAGKTRRCVRWRGVGLHGVLVQVHFNP